MLETIYRHRLLTRLCHWVNVLALSLLLMSGLQIFNAHPRLYWGPFGADADIPILEMTSKPAADGGLIGVVRLGDREAITTGLLGVSRVDGEVTPRGFPAWATLPSGQDLATGRRWHFFLAWILVINGLLYLANGFISGHFRRDVTPTRAELKPRHLLHDIWDHLRLKAPRGEASKRYNTLQKLTYLVVIFALLPMMLLTGLTMSPGFNAIAPILLDLFGGRQSARTLHFICANLIVLFVIVHLVEVVIAGAWNEIRSMITGWYVVKPEARDAES